MSEVPPTGEPGAASEGEPEVPPTGEPGAASEGEPGELRRFAVVDSTNRYLLDEARAGAPDGLAAVAEHQRAGRGRLGRRWEAPPGTSLLASFLLRPVLDPARLHLCTAMVALAGADACRAVAGVEPVVKWPNDLLVGEAKLAGVLAESDPRAPGGPPGSTAVVVGIGINVDWPGPPGAGGTSLAAEAGRPVDREALLEALRRGVARRRRSLDAPAGWSALAAELQHRCATVGRRVRVTTGRGDLVGTATGLTAAGHLVLDTGAGAVEVAAGDVVHLRPSEPAPGSSPGAPSGGQ